MAKKNGKQAISQLKKMDETGRRDPGQDRRQTSSPFAVERRKGPRRRQIDPTTCERDYTDDEVEFMQALDQYKRRSGRMFPTCSEILEVIRGLGYSKADSAEIAGKISDFAHGNMTADELDDLQV